MARFNLTIILTDRKNTRAEKLTSGFARVHMICVNHNHFTFKMQPNIVPQAGHTLPHAPTVRENATEDPFELLKADHDAFRALLAAFPLVDTQRRRVIALELSREIVAHASAEERHLHELYRKHLPKEEGDAYFSDSLTADQRNIEALRTLEKETGEEKEPAAPSAAGKEGNAPSVGVAGGAGLPQPGPPAVDASAVHTLYAGFKSPPATGLSKAATDAFRQLYDTETVRGRLSRRDRSGLSSLRCRNQLQLLVMVTAPSLLLAASCPHRSSSIHRIALQEHMREEEERYFPKLRAAMSAEQQKELYRALVAAKKDAPTHASFLTVHRPDKPGLAANVSSPP